MHADLPEQARLIVRRTERRLGETEQAASSKWRLPIQASITNMRMLAGVQIPGPLLDVYPAHIKNKLYCSPMVITRARPSRVHFSSDEIHVTVRKSPESDETDQQSLRTLVESKCPSLFSEFSHAWWLFKLVTRVSHPSALLTGSNTVATCRPCIVLRETFQKSIKSSTIGNVQTASTVSNLMCTPERTSV
jgi:hypothetical protein